MSKTLKRRVDFRPIEAEDTRYAWAAYRLGALTPMGGVFADTGMNGAEFREVFVREVMKNYDGAWTLFAETKRGFVPIGLLLAFWPHPNPAYIRCMTVGGVAWFPWASTRNKVEALVNFFNVSRREIPMIGYARPEHKKMYETVAKHGIMRRVGTSENVFGDAPAAVFETRAQ